VPVGLRIAVRESVCIALAHLVNQDTSRIPTRVVLSIAIQKEPPFSRNAIAPVRNRLQVTATTDQSFMPGSEHVDD
jgi:hypothetical protein